MKIVKAESILVSVPFEATGIPPWSFGGNPRCAFDTLFVRLETDSGIVGWGEAFSRNEDRSLKMTLDTRVLPLVLGRDANGIGRIKQSLQLGVRAPHQHIAERSSEGLDWSDDLLAFFRLSAVAGEQGHDRLPVPLLGEPGRRRCRPHQCNEGQFGRGVFHE